MKDKIINWFNKGGDVFEGMLLLVLVDPSKKNTSYRNPSKLFYELCKAGNCLDWYYTHLDEKTREVVFPDKVECQETAKPVQAEELEDFEFAIKYEDLPALLQEKIIRKGQLYSELDILKKQLVATGETNEPGLIDHRKDLITRSKGIVEQIKLIYKELRDYESGKDKPVADPKLYEGDEEGLFEAEYHYRAMNQEQLKELFSRMRKTFDKQRQRSEEGTEKSMQSNKEKADKTLHFIRFLEAYLKKLKHAV